MGCENNTLAKDLTTQRAIIMTKWSETLVEKLNPTSTTDFSYKTLCIVFFGAPCSLADNGHPYVFWSGKCAHIFHL